MRMLLLLGLLPFSVMAEPIDLANVNRAVNQGIAYLDYRGWDFRDVGAGGYGNCAAMAYTKWKRLQELGYSDRATIRTCTLAIGTPHAFVVVDEQWLLDNNTNTIRPLAQSGCEGRIVTVRNASLQKWVSQWGDRRPLPRVARQALQSLRDASGSGQ